MTRLSSRDRRALLVGSSLIVCAVLLLRALPAWWGAVQRAVEVAAEERRKLNDGRAVIAIRSTMRDSLAARRARLADAEEALIATSSARAAASRLGATLTRAARDAGVAVSSVSVQADTTSAAEFGRPAARVEARGDIAGLTKLLHALESGSPLIRVRELTVTQPDVAGIGRPEELRLALLVEGVSRLDSLKASRGRQ